MSILKQLKDHKDMLEAVARKKTAETEMLLLLEQLISEQEVLDEKELSLAIYHTDEITSTFKNLKYRLENKLINDLFVLTNYGQRKDIKGNAMINVEKTVVVAGYLLRQGYRTIAIKLFERALKVCKKFSLTEMKMRIYPVLVNHYSFVEVDKKIMKKINTEWEHTHKDYDAELRVRRINARISHFHVNTGRNVSADIADLEREQIASELEEIRNNHFTVYIQAFCSEQLCYYYQGKMDFEKSLKIAKEGLAQCQKLLYYDSLFYFNVYLQIAVSYYYLKNYKNADDYFKKSIKLTTQGGRVWFYVNSLYFLSLASQKKYQELATLSNEIFRSKDLVNHPYLHDEWKIRKGFVNILKILGKIKPQPGDKDSDFSIKKFVNNFEVHSNDKSGRNVAIIIIQVLYLLIQKNYDEVNDNVDRLMIYTYRYLHKDDTYRTQCFIKMLLALSQYKFNPKRVKQRTANLYKKLTTSPISINENSRMNEVIPYEDLWELIVEIVTHR